MSQNSQGLAPFEFVGASPERAATARAGLCPYLELACVAGLGQSVAEHVQVCSQEQGFTAEQVVLSPICLNLAGGECVDDLRILESDEGFGRPSCALSTLCGTVRPSDALPILCRLLCAMRRN